MVDHIEAASIKKATKALYKQALQHYIKYLADK